MPTVCIRAVADKTHALFGYQDTELNTIAVRVYTRTTIAFTPCSILFSFLSNRFLKISRHLLKPLWKV